MIKEVFNRTVARFGRLKRRLGSRAFRDALTETLVTLVTATLPIWFFPLIALFIISTSFSLHLLDHSLSNGELFLFCTSLVGPLLYALFKIYEVDDNEPRKLKYKITWVFPHGLKFAALIFFICIVSAAIFGLQKINPQFSGAEISKGGYITLSVVLFVVSVVAFVIAIMLRNEMESYSPSQVMRDDEDTFAEIYRSGERRP